MLKYRVVLSYLNWIKENVDINRGHPTIKAETQLFRTEGIHFFSLIIISPSLLALKSGGIIDFDRLESPLTFDNKGCLIDLCGFSWISSFMSAQSTSYSIHLSNWPTPWNLSQVEMEVCLDLLIWSSIEWSVTELRAWCGKRKWCKRL